MSDSLFLLSAFDDSFIEVGYMFDRIFHKNYGKMLKFEIKKYSDRNSYFVTFAGKDIPKDHNFAKIMVLKIDKKSNITLVEETIIWDSFSKYENIEYFGYHICEDYLPKNINTKFIFKVYFTNSRENGYPPNKIKIKDFNIDVGLHNKNNELLNDVIPSICVRCGSSGDLRKLKVDCGYDLSESTAFKKSDKKNSGYYVTVCKDCRSKFITLLRAWL